MYVLVPTSDKICWLTEIQALTNRKESVTLVEVTWKHVAMILVIQLKLINIECTLFQKNYNKV